MSLNKTTSKKLSAKKSIAFKKSEKKLHSNKNNKISRQVKVFARTTHKSQQWIKEMQSQLKWMSADNIYQLLRAVLQTLRDQLSINETAHFSAQLPLLLRGTFYEGWDPKLIQGRSISKELFLKSVSDKIKNGKLPNFELEDGVLLTLNVIKKHISAGEINDLIGTLNPSLKNFILISENQQQIIQ